MERDARKKIHMLIMFSLLVVAIALYLIIPSLRDGVNEAARKLVEADIEAFRDYLLSFGVWAPVVSFFLMIFTLIVAPLPAFVVTFSNGLLFGAFWGGILSWTSAMVGAAICFYIARSLGRPVVEKIVSKTALNWTDKFFERYGMHSVLLARLIPVVSFALISYASGLTAIRFMVFFIATGVGQLPATILYSILGQNANKSVLVVFWAFIAVICFGVLGAAFKPWFEKKFKKGEVA
ncbi:TVP38/TMEM64 family protein [Anaerobacillus isosaccharinicus]|uniref:TVP38/TMEM64 family protein n=2 Tax=Anaerobacillus isosaccharinicus TaxID=1532552 RepID=A0A7S7LCN9_9BACI|nr:TVP38/TMEM64 family protein [Anaerobacillus isosaccharinicus]